MGIYDAWNRLRSGIGIETRSLENNEGQKELQDLYSKWKEDILLIPHPGYFAKNVEIYFIYHNIRYNFDKRAFVDYVQMAEKEGKNSPYGCYVDAARFESLLYDVVIKDLIKIGVHEEELFCSGSLD